MLTQNTVTGTIVTPILGFVERDVGDLQVRRYKQKIAPFLHTHTLAVSLTDTYTHQSILYIQHLSPSPDEVEALFTLSIPQLLDPALAGHEDLGLRSSKAPYYLGGPAKASVLLFFGWRGVVARATSFAPDNLTRTEPCMYRCGA